MIERLLTAEAALRNGELELAGRLFAQVAEADGRNAIAVVGLARIAEREGRMEDAQALVQRALAIDPDEAAALRLIRELAVAEVAAATIPTPFPVPDPAPDPVANTAPAPVPNTAPARVALKATRQEAPRRRSLVQRVRAWLGGLGGRS
jgi:thioredoxin-like negative regulator of GroEL